MDHKDMYSSNKFLGHRDLSHPDKFNEYIFVNLGCMQNFGFLYYVEVGTKDVLWVGVFIGEIIASLWFRLVSQNLSDFQPNRKSTNQGMKPKTKHIPFRPPSSNPPEILPKPLDTIKIYSKHPPDTLHIPLHKKINLL